MISESFARRCRQLLCLSALAVASYGQVTTTSIIGSISDRSGATVPEADVTVTNKATNFSRSAKSNRIGGYRLEFLPVGEYQIDVSATGFKGYSRKGVVLDVGVTARVDAVLELGTTNESVTVTADVPAVNTDNAQIGRTVTTKEITELPLVNRNVYTLLSLTPGVESNQSSNTLGFPEQRTFINGGVDGGAGSVNYFLDGGNNMTGLRNTGNVAPNPDAVQEFRVITNSYSAEYGRFAGGVINVITRSGSNQLHGSLFEFLRNDALNANTWGASSKAPLRRNQFGASAGGPIKRDKTFFFGTYSGLRQTTSTFVNSAVVPTALERAGNFSQSKVQPIDPLTKLPFANGIIPVTRFDPTALTILNQYIPLPNSPGNVYQAQLPSPYNTDEVMFKVDHQLTSTQQLSVSYYNTWGVTSILPSGGNLPWSMQQLAWRQQNANASDTWTLSPNTVNQAWLTYTRNFGGRLNLPSRSLGDLGSSFAVQGTPSLPQITVTGYFTLAQAIMGPVAGTNFYSFRDMVTHQQGRHSLKFGVEENLNKDIQQTLLNNYGVFAFSGTTSARTGNALSDFLLGLPATMNQDSPVNAYDNSWSTGLFFQDDWRITPRLTVNLGVRWDLQTPPTDPQNREATFIPGVQSKVLPNAPLGLLVVGDPGVTRGVVPMRKHNFSPRIGFAYDPFGTGKTSIRGGAGVFYGSVSGNEWNTMSNFQPFAVRQQFTTVQSLTNPYGLLPGGVSPYPYNYDPRNPRFLTGAALWAVSPDFVWPYTYQLNFSVERQITNSFSLTGAYVGSLSRRLPFAEDINYPTAYGTTAVNSRRPILPNTLSSISVVKSVMNANYHSLQITADKRMDRHFSVRSFYTFSKTLSDAQLVNNTTGGGAEDFNNLSLERGRSDFDRRHNFVSSVIWNSNYFDRSNRVVRAALSNWEVSSILAFRSGLPFTVLSGRDSNNDGTNNDRANLVGNPFLDPHRSRSDVTGMWFNTAAFVQAPLGTDGNAGRNILDGPGFRNVDLALFRNFKFGEQVNLQFRAEMTNALNLVSLGQPTATVSSTLFGQIRTANDMRQTQLGLRLVY